MSELRVVGVKGSAGSAAEDADGQMRSVCAEHDGMLSDETALRACKDTDVVKSGVLNMTEQSRASNRTDVQTEAMLHFLL